MADGFLAFSEVNCLHVAAFLRNVNPHKATEPDGIRPLMLSKFSNILTSSTGYLVNESLSRATVPQAFKQAAVCPIFKKGELNISSNYRPVSLLSSLSKILERVVLCQLQNFISQSELLSSLPTAMAIPVKISSIRTLTIGMWRWMQGR